MESKVRRGPGRPSAADATKRARTTGAAALARCDARFMRSLAREIGEPLAVVEKDLVAARALLEAEPTIPSDLARALSDPTTFAQIEEAIRLAREAYLGGRLTDDQARHVLDSLRAQSATIAKRGPDRVDPIAMALDVLIPQEWAAVESYRASVRTPPIKPGESPPPPPEEQESSA